MSDNQENTVELLPTPGDGEGISPSEYNQPEAPTTFSEAMEELEKEGSGDETGYNGQSTPTEGTETTTDGVGEDASDAIPNDSDVGDAVSGFTPPTEDEIKELNLKVHNELPFPFSLVNMEEYTQTLLERSLTEQELSSIKDTFTESLTKLLEKRGTPKEGLAFIPELVGQTVEGYMSMVDKGYEEHRAILKEKEEYVNTLRETTPPQQLEEVKAVFDKMTPTEIVKFEDYLLNEYDNREGLIDRLNKADNVVDDIKQAYEEFKKNGNTLGNFLKELTGATRSKLNFAQYAHKELRLQGVAPDNPTDEQIRQYATQLRNIKGNFFHPDFKGILNDDILAIINKQK